MRDLSFPHGRYIGMGKSNLPASVCSVYAGNTVGAYTPENSHPVNSTSVRPRLIGLETFPPLFLLRDLAFR